jgi:hypothetical protein
MDNNDWILAGDPVDVESPPNGSWLRVRYENGDDISVRFREWVDTSALEAVYPRALDLGSMLRFPLVTAEITFKVGGTNISFGSNITQMAGVAIRAPIAAYCLNGLDIG